MKNSEQPAYPLSYINSGLTKREYFAAMAMQGILANSAEQSYSNQQPCSFLSIQEQAQMAVQYADALLSELEKPQQQ